ncbi:MAG: helix-turn-helix domain-containing protein [bacterium]
MNSHRVEAAKKQIADPANSNKSLAEIGFDVGFNSITSFNTAFKKHALMTPSLYRQSVFDTAASGLKKSSASSYEESSTK